MRREIKALRRKLLRVLPVTGPLNRNVCVAHLGGNEQLLDELVREGKVKMVGSKRGSKYAHA